MMYGGLYQLLQVREMEVEGGPSVVFPVGTIVKTVALSELEQQLGNVSKYQVIEVSFPDEETKKQYGLQGGLGAAQAKAEVAGLGREFIATAPERLIEIGVLKEIPQSPQSSQ